MIEACLHSSWRSLKKNSPSVNKFSVNFVFAFVVISGVCFIEITLSLLPEFSMNVLFVSVNILFVSMNVLFGSVNILFVSMNVLFGSVNALFL